ncbi:hypothetical protein ABB55_27280 [Prosthecomicrobium hirschii]|uniref:Uncharacterized protein n=1 Tax=Prosthecodimorpha hirschii TaxID=665126 RepID=A0A0P6VRX6_9HYPH|nr:hypothetical protein [Prosthecomicrobium hirschii]KPL55482.1 hypothetical protein ABB55_27280 [Prosthecomicrobium hirschii]
MTEDEVEDVVYKLAEAARDQMLELGFDPEVIGKAMIAHGTSAYAGAVGPLRRDEVVRHLHGLADRIGIPVQGEA